jgi:hypothetical protein
MLFQSSSVFASDWLIHKPASGSKIQIRSEVELEISNSLIRRVFRLSPNAASIGFDNLMTGESILRGVKPECRITLNGIEYDVGGLKGQPNYAYLLPEWIEKLTNDAAAFQFRNWEERPVTEPFPWKRNRHSSSQQWPPQGVHLVLNFKPPKEAPGNIQEIRVAVHYELYDSIPVLCKWMEIQNLGDEPVLIDRFTSEILAAIEYESSVERRGKVFEHPEITPMRPPNMHIESDFIFGAMEPVGGNRTVHWIPDPEYLTQVNYLRNTPNLLEVRPPLGPDWKLDPGENFQTFRTYELIFDSYDRERNGLAKRRMYRTIAPWTTENPIMMHVRSAEPEAVKSAIDQCAEVGFEMVILTFGSGFNVENDDPAYIQQMKELVDYAHSKGVELGGYSLLASRKISPDQDVIHWETGKPGDAFFGNSPCLESEWGNRYFEKLYNFFSKTGFDVLEHDGSYPGDACASTSHAGHRGLKDSQYKQWRKITEFYRWCRSKGIYLNVPDWYFLSGSTKTAMGYRETNWSLPREEQIIHARQNIYDGTWYKTPSMGWMFVPLVEYHGGGAEATLEPLSEHLQAYDLHLANLFGSGVQAAYRGPRLYDSEKTRELVKGWVEFFKRYRAILESDIIHVRRADGRDIDCMMHVNPELQEKALAMVWNPLNEAVERELKLPLYYTGLTDETALREKEGTPRTYSLDRDYSIKIKVRLPARGYTWFVME